jgi:hypothetical protein
MFARREPVNREKKNLKQNKSEIDFLLAGSIFFNVSPPPPTLLK